MASWRYIPLLALVGASLLACGGKQAAPKPRAVLVIRCPVATAEVWVDSRFVNECAALRRGVRVSPGAHRIEVRHEDYTVNYLDVELEANERKIVEVELYPKLP